MDIDSVRGKIAITIYKGETFYFRLVECVDYDNNLIDFTGGSFVSQCRFIAADGTPGDLVANMTVAVVTLGEVLVTSPTSAWPVGQFYFDILFTDSGGRKLWLIERTVVRCEQSATET